MSSNIKYEKIKMPENMDYNVVFNTDKDKIKFIKRVEKTIRSSMEYRDYINFLKDYINMNHCAFFNNVENDEGTKVHIEIHHDPLTLFDIVKVIINKYIDESIPLDEMYIADEVMKLHYENMVGLIPLSKSIHQIVHNSNEIFIPLTLIYGDYKKFLEDYNDYIDEDIMYKIQTKIDQTKVAKRDMFENVLNPTYVYMDVEGYSLPKKIELVKDITA